MDKVDNTRFVIYLILGGMYSKSSGFMYFENSIK